MHDAGPTTALPPQPTARGHARLLRPWTWGRRAWLTILASACLIVLTVLGTQWYLTQPKRWFLQALAAVERGDRDEVDRLVLRLEGRGRIDEGRFVRGKAAVLAGRRDAQELLAVARQDSNEQGLSLLLDLSGQIAQPLHLRPDLVCQSHSAAEPWPRWRPTERRRDVLEERIRAAFESGLRDLGSVRQDSPLWLEAAGLCGDCLYRLGDQRESAKVLNDVVKQSPDDVEVHRLLAAIYFDLGAVSLAEHHAKEIARLDPADGRPFRLIGSMHKDFHHIDEAANAYRAALARQLSPAARAEVIRELTELLLEDLGSDEEALTTLEQCPPPWRDAPDMLVLRANCIWRSANKAESIRLVDAALRADPDLPSALVLRAKLHLHYEQSVEAIRLLARAARLDPADYKTQSQLAGAYKLRAAQIGDEVPGLTAVHGWSIARDLLGGQPAVSVTVWGAALELQRHMLEERTEDHRRASDQIKDALTKLTELSRQASVEPWNAQVRFEIAKVWLQLDKPAMTRSWLNATLTCDPEHAAAREALQAMEGKGQ